MARQGQRRSREEESIQRGTDHRHPEGIGGGSGDGRAVPASNNLAHAMLQTGGNLDVALSLAQTARRGLPDSPGVADTLAWIDYQKGAYQSAVGLLQEALKLQEKNKMPDNPDIHYHLGMAYEKTDHPALARQH